MEEKEKELKEMEKLLAEKLQKKELRKERKLMKDKLKDLPPEKPRKPRTVKPKQVVEKPQPIQTQQIQHPITIQQTKPVKPLPKYVIRF